MEDGVDLRDSKEVKLESAGVDVQLRWRYIFSLNEHLLWHIRRGDKDGEIQY